MFNSHVDYYKKIYIRTKKILYQVLQNYTHFFIKVAPVLRSITSYSSLILVIFCFLLKNLYLFINFNNNFHLFFIFNNFFNSNENLKIQSFYRSHKTMWFWQGGGAFDCQTAIGRCLAETYEIGFKNRFFFKLTHLLFHFLKI